MYDDDKDNYKVISRDDEIRNRRAEQARERRNRQRGLNLEERLFFLCSRYLVLFLTLNYKVEYRADITLRTIQRNRDTLLKYMESHNHSLLSGIYGCIWRLEEGERGGALHLHLLIFYSGARHGDVTIARQIGEYWINIITRGIGDYWNSNAHKGHFEKRWGVGIGQVNRHDDLKRDSLQAFIENYMAKADQVPRDRNEDDKLFGARFFDRKHRRE